MQLNRGVGCAVWRIHDVMVMIMIMKRQIPLY